MNGTQTHLYLTWKAKKTPNTWSKVASDEL